jgi:hypothetical protein
MLHVAPIPSLFAILSKKESKIVDIVDMELQFRFLCSETCRILSVFNTRNLKSTKRSCHLKTKNPTDPVGSNELKDYLVRNPLLS